MTVFKFFLRIMKYRHLTTNHALEHLDRLDCLGHRSVLVMFTKMLVRIHCFAATCINVVLGELFLPTYCVLYYDCFTGTCTRFIIMYFRITSVML